MGVKYGPLRNAKYLPRLVDREVQECLEDFGGVCIQGPKYCGKTWTGRAFSQSEITLMASTETSIARELIVADPRLALDGASPRLIDEWQEMPSVWDMVRYAIDAGAKERRFILTGSATPRREKPSHSGVGRIERVSMRTMTLSESGESSAAVSLGALFSGERPSTKAPESSAELFAGLVVRGGWPGTIGLSSRRAGRLPASYVKAFLTDDMHKMDDQRRDPEKMERLMRSYARTMEQAATPKTLVRDMTGDAAHDPLAIETVEDYSSLLRDAFLLEEISPWVPAIRSKYRISKKPKYHYTDPSLPAALLGVTPTKLMADFETFGFLFESMCVHDLLVYAQAIDARLFYYRDQSGLEADVIIESADGAWAALEIKLGHHQVEKAASNLLTLRDRIIEGGAREPAFLAVVEGVGDYAYVRPDDVCVIPILTLGA